MKSLHATTAFIEGCTGLALLVCPSGVVMLLLGAPIDSPAALIVGRMMGAALVALAIGCWFTRYDLVGCAAKGVVVGMLFYNVAAVVLFAYAGLGLELRGIALWPAILVHTGMAIWCSFSLRVNPVFRNHTNPSL